MMTRRFFIGGAASFCALRPNRIFSATSPVEACGRPALTFGVISDVHIGMAKGGRELAERYMTDTFRATLARFRDAGVDAVVIAGDIAHNGIVPELEAVGKVWYEIFPNDRAPDGRKVERIFVTGNHDNGIWRAKRVYSNEKEATANLISLDYRKWWDKVFYEEWKSSFRKEVKGPKRLLAVWNARP